MTWVFTFEGTEIAQGPFPFEDFAWQKAKEYAEEYNLNPDDIRVFQM